MMSATATQAACHRPASSATSRRQRGVKVQACLRDGAERLAKGAAAAAAAGLLLTGSTLAASERMTFDELQSKSYLEMKGSGRAGMCPMVGPDGEVGIRGMPTGTYKMDRFCMEPTAFNVKVPGDNEYRKSTLVTRLTYMLSDMTGTVTVGNNGTMALTHGMDDDGFDYAAVTVKAAGSPGQGGEVPFMFSVKNLDIKGPSDNMAGSLVVPSYRGATFMDTIGRGGATGWDWQKGLPAADQDKLREQNDKALEPTPGSAAFAVTKSDPLTGEVQGVFVTRQLSSDDMGGKPEDVCEVEVQGVWYGQLQV
ncbi:Oxygen-evolving enhancer chloroplastic [Chlorella sorokiniana]|uniref:Oxygen-evolving enhancer chloroplastic n=1 Tax=Chlorella sorokiniana TaxID=3076 RepID=A0A2P6TTW4_CHLSO|nr:Oxygen-evolving enhancer chloroplastic [Chlorella sorokiniana]|eukprot:PRW57515.1 Oxygen-evolving enhancer chloroplastic [Chlorella sorokiniana]